jgi:hypothetical protein
MCVALPKYIICLRYFENQKHMETVLLHVVVDNVGGHPVFHAIPANTSQFLMQLSKLYLNFLWF